MGYCGFVLFYYLVSWVWKLCYGFFVVDDVGEFGVVCGVIVGGGWGWVLVSWVEWGWMGSLWLGGVGFGEVKWRCYFKFGFGWYLIFDFGDFRFFLEIFNVIIFVVDDCINVNLRWIE